ncbi:MAG: hypothetical protein CMJ49_09385, partial [Planctomycetaceae bacterium]|nr:hypothetical protein [Planctomycetaceae bacterium]
MIVENAKLFITNPVEPVAPPANPTEGDGFNQLLESLRTPTDDSNGGALGAIEPRDRNRRDQPDDDASRQSEPRNESPDAAERADAAAPTDRDTSADESDQPAETNSEDQNTEPVAAEPTGRDAEKPADTESDAADSTDISAASQSVQVAKPDAADPLRLIVPRDPAPKQAQPTQPQTETVVSNQAAQRAAAATAQSVTPQTNTATPETQTNAQNAPNTAQESVRRAPVAEVQPQARPQPQAQPTDARTANQVAPQPTSRDSETESARPRTPAPTPVQSSPIQDRSDQPAYRDSANRDAAQRDTADPDTRRSNAPQTRQLPADAQVTVERPAPRANQALDQPARPDAAATPDQSARAALATITNTESATPTTTQIATDNPDAASAARAASQSS